MKIFCFHAMDFYIRTTVLASSWPFNIAYLHLTLSCMTNKNKEMSRITLSHTPFQFSFLQLYRPLIFGVIHICTKNSPEHSILLFISRSSDDPFD